RPWPAPPAGPAPRETPRPARQFRSARIGPRTSGHNDAVGASVADDGELGADAQLDADVGPAEQVPVVAQHRLGQLLVPWCGAGERDLATKALRRLVQHDVVPAGGRGRQAGGSAADDNDSPGA